MSLFPPSVPSPEPYVDVSEKSPTATAVPTLIIEVSSTDPWMWSLDTVVALAGAFSSMVVAVVAILVTLRIAERDARDRRAELQKARTQRARAERKLVAEAATTYLKSVDEFRGEKEAHDNLVRTFAESDIDEEPLYRWLVESGQTRFAAYFNAREEADPDPDSSDPPKASWFAYQAVDAEIRSRLRSWVRSGEIDTAPVAAPTQSSSSSAE
jgi:hypothetical protein